MARILLIAIFILCGCPAGAQNLNNDIEEASRLHKQYRFEEAVYGLENLKNRCADSLILAKADSLLLLCQNGRAMLDFGDKPIVLASDKVSTENMLLYVPSLEDRGWVRTPAYLSNVDINTMYDYAYFPEDAEAMYYSAVEEDGSRDLYVIRHIAGNQWSSPEKLNSNICSSGNEIFPIAGKDGKTLYFASDGLSGYGGYDVYYSEWDPALNDWGVPQNFGFPYNSPENDYLFLEVADGVFSYLISDRFMEGRQAALYTILYNSTPVKYEIGESEALQISRLAKYVPEKKTEMDYTENVPEEFKEYFEIKHFIEDVDMELAEVLSENDTYREQYRKASSDDRMYIKNQIFKNESRISQLKKSRVEYVSLLHRCEMELIAAGLEIPESDEKKEKTPEVTLPEPPVVIKKALGTLPELEIKPAEPEVDLELKVLDEAVILDDSYLPKAGLYYQVQLFTVAGKVRLSSLKGLSPVFEERTRTGKYIYRAGIFYSYESALQGMNLVKRAGIRNVFLSAAMDGESMTVKQARALETSGGAHSYQVAMSGFASGIPPEVVKMLQNICDKDLARIVEEGRVIYILGPFSNRGDAEKILEALEAMDITGIEIKEI